MKSAFGSRKYARVRVRKEESRMAESTPPRRAAPRSGPGAAALSPAIEQQINENLRRLYQQAAEEPIPERLRELLDRLKEQGSEG